MKKRIFILLLFLSTILAFSTTEPVAAAPKSEKNCKVTIENNKTEESYTVTFHGVTCGELIAQLMSIRL